MVTVCGMTSFLLTTSMTTSIIGVMGREKPQTKRFLVQFKKCIHCGQLMLRKISKIGAIRCQILRLKCTKFDLRCGSAPDPAVEATFKGPTSKGRGRRGKRKVRRRGREGKGRG